MARTNGCVTGLDGALTVDLEDWKCALNPRPGASHRERPKVDEEYIRSSTKSLLRELEDTGTKATFFVLGEVARAVPEVVRGIAQRGHEIASHSQVHLPPRMIPRGEFVSLLKQDLVLLENLTGTRPKGFRAPYFALRRDEGWLLKELAALGFWYDSTVAPTWTPYWGMPSAPKAPYFPDFSDLAKSVTEGPILEIPLTVWPSWKMLPGLPVGGGFYMRLWPMPLLRRMFNRNLRAGFPLLLYVHPGNLQSEKERVEQPTARDLISQYALSSRGLPSFRQLLRSFKLGTILCAFESSLGTAGRQS